MKISLKISRSDGTRAALNASALSALVPIVAQYLQRLLSRETVSVCGMPFDLDERLGRLPKGTRVRYLGDLTLRGEVINPGDGREIGVQWEGLKCALFMSRIWLTIDRDPQAPPAHPTPETTARHPLRVWPNFKVGDQVLDHDGYLHVIEEIDARDRGLLLRCEPAGTEWYPWTDVYPVTLTTMQVRVGDSARYIPDGRICSVIDIEKNGRVARVRWDTGLTDLTDWVPVTDLKR